ncbi:hypothetical protein Taro_000783 [Colocasia esculenta]|uniref:Uncharacterized protein n=1 Tax=Colocasia esculenta TaxID=4460 RepID=A0A843TG82_COLES|nr:hypothetical protein [Colocasia esculenta]
MLAWYAREMCCVHVLSTVGTRDYREISRGSMMPTVVTSPVGCPRFSMSQAVSSGLVPEVEMADRGDWGGGGEDPEESTQRMIERIEESLTDIQMRMDQQATVPPIAVPQVARVPVAPVPPPPGVEATVRSWEVDSGQVRYWFKGLERGVPSHYRSAKPKLPEEERGNFSSSWRRRKEKCQKREKGCRLRLLAFGPQDATGRGVSLPTVMRRPPRPQPDRTHPWCRDNQT